MNKEQKDLAIKLIDETVEYYSSHPRSISEEGNNCKYVGDNDEKCAFSRCCIDDAEYDEGRPASCQRMKYLLPEYQILASKLTFWNKIQHIHDGGKNWDNSIFTKHGYDYVDRFKDFIKNDLDLTDLLN